MHAPMALLVAALSCAALLLLSCPQLASAAYGTEISGAVILFRLSEFTNYEVINGKNATRYVVDQALHMVMPCTVKCLL